MWGARCCLFDLFLFFFKHKRIVVTKLELLGRGDDPVGSPHRAQIYQFELFKLILLVKLDKQFPVEQFDATVSQSTVPSPLFITSAKSMKIGVLVFKGSIC